MTGPFDLHDRVALVTGASRGLGLAFAHALAGAGADLVITSRNVRDLERAQQELARHGGRVAAVALDVRDPESIASCTQRAVAAFGRVDVLVNNAGCNVRKPALEVTWDDWATVLDTNLRGSFFVAQAIARGMVERRRGRIVNVGSLTARFGYVGLAPYAASRGGIAQLTATLAAEWGPFGVTVNCLAPGWFRTDQNAVLYDDPSFVARLTERIPLGRTGLPHDLDGALVFLASDASAYVTGQTIYVDGGKSTGAMSALPGPR